MLGYASAPADLGRGDELGGRLATGDLAECDSDGYFRLTGRLARFAKLFGKRVDLVSLETEVESVFRGRAAILDKGRPAGTLYIGSPARRPARWKSAPTCTRSWEFRQAPSGSWL